MSTAELDNHQTQARLQERLLALLAAGMPSHRQQAGLTELDGEAAS